MSLKFTEEEISAAIKIKSSDTFLKAIKDRLQKENCASLEEAALRGQNMLFEVLLDNIDNFNSREDFRTFLETMANVQLCVIEKMAQ